MGAGALLELLRVWPASPGRLRVEDEAALVHAAARHGLAGLVQHALEQGGVVLGEPARLGLRRQALAQAALALRVRGLLLRVVDALAGEGVVPVLLKGYGLAWRLYPEPLLRATSDVDVLVGRGEVEVAARVLAGLGLKAPGALEAARALADSHHLEFSGPQGLVELHFRALAGWGLALEAQGLLERAEEALLEGRRVRFLRAEDELAYLAVHASNHLLQRLAWLFDLKLLVRARPGLRWADVVEAAQAPGWGPAAWYALEAAQRLVGAQVPEEVLGALAPPAWQRQLARQLFSPERLLETALARHKPLWWSAKLALAPRLSPMARYTARRAYQAAQALWPGR